VTSGRLRAAALALVLAAAFGARAAADEAEDLLEKAAALEDEGKVAEATQLYAEILEKYPDNARAYNNFGAVLLHAGKKEEAKKAFRKASELDPAYDTPLNNLGYLYLVDEDYENAGVALRAAAELNANNERTLNNLRALYIVQDEYADAAAEWEKLSRFAPENARIKQDLAGIYIKLGDFAAAEKWAKATLALDAANTDARFNLVFIYRMTSRPAEAERVLAGLAQTNPDDADVRSALRDVYLGQGKLEDALAAARATVELSPGPDAYLGLAAVLYEMRRYDEGVEACDRALALRDDAAARNMKGRGLYLAGRYDEAEAELSMAVARESGFADGHRNLADVYYQQWRFDLALEHYRAAARLDPRDERSRVMIGYCLYQSGDLDGAARVFGDALATFPENAKALNGMAAVARARGDTEAAVDYCLKALAVSPENAEALNTVGVLYGELNDFESSYQYLKRLVALAPGPAYAYANFGVTAARLGKWEEARAAFEAAAAREPGDLQAQAGLALAAARTAKWAQADAAAAAAAAIDAENPIELYARALLAAKNGDRAGRDECLAAVAAAKERWDKEGAVADALTALVFEEAAALAAKK
jgi:Flp pilus assembly protein TadD